MRIETTIVNAFLNGEHEYHKHWLFRNIEDDGTFLFDCPSEDSRQDIQNALHDTLLMLNDFHPYNASLFEGLFPKWRELCDTINVIISVGCPAPYDAMVRDYGGESFIIIDLARLLEYKMDIKTLVTPLFTHELAHVCIHADYPPDKTNQEYRDRLEYIVFDEGFAHLLAYRDSIEHIDFSAIINEHYQASLTQLKKAMCEINSEKQKECLQQANAGNYWNKYGAIAGKLFLAMHIDDMAAIYKSGPKKMYESICTMGTGPLVHL